MVFFTCNGCGSSLKKGAVEKHYQVECRRCEVLSCMDCGKDFHGDDYKLHTSCVSEDQKYGGKDFKAAPNKGDVKQAEWMERVRKAGENPAVPFKVKQVLKKFQGGLLNNVPRKKPKFMNFLKNSLRMHDANVAEKVWEILNTPQGPEKETPKTNGTSENTLNKQEHEKNSSDTQNGSCDDDRNKGKKRKRQKEPSVEETEVPGEEPNPVKKKKKKKKKNAEIDDKEVSDSGHKQEEGKNGTNTMDLLMNGKETDQSEEGKENKKKKKRRKERDEEEDKKVEEESEKLPDEVEEPSIVQASGKFPWEQVIIQVLKKSSDKKISLKKLRRKVLSEYHSRGGDPRIKTEEKLESTFHKKVTKNPKFTVKHEVVEFTAR